MEEGKEREGGVKNNSGFWLEQLPWIRYSIQRDRAPWEKNLDPKCSVRHTKLQVSLNQPSEDAK